MNRPIRLSGAKCQKERDASEDIAFRNHGEYIKYLTKIKEKEDDAHAAWAVTKAELDKKAQAEAELRAIDAALAKTRVSAPPKPPAAPPVAPARSRRRRRLPPPMSGAQDWPRRRSRAAWSDSCRTTTVPLGSLRVPFVCVGRLGGVVGSAWPPASAPRRAPPRPVVNCLHRGLLHVYDA